MQDPMVTDQQAHSRQDESAVPLDEALAPYARRTADRKEQLVSAAARRRELHEAITIERADMFAALDRQIDAGGIGDVITAAAQERRFVRAQLVLADLCGTASAYYKEGSTPHMALSLAAAALGWAAWRHPELVGELRAELAAEKKARVA